MERSRCWHIWFSLGILLAIGATAHAQVTTGSVEGTLRAADARRVPQSQIVITGGTGFRAVIQPDANGKFAITIPYGRYTFGGVPVFVAPLETTHIDLAIDGSGNIRATPRPPGSTQLYPEAFSLFGLLLSREQSSVTEPLDFTGLRDNRLAVVSQRGFSWTDTRYKFHGMDATDSYQPGRPVLLPDVQALEAVVVTPLPKVGVFLGEPRTSWHGALSTANTGAALSSSGVVQQTDRFHWFTRDRLEIGGPITRWADIYASGAGQWASQTEPLYSPGADQRSRLLFGNVRGRVRAGAGNLFDALYSGSRIDLSDGGMPAGIEALTGNRLAPSFVLPGGFPGAAEVDHLDFIQAGWTHLWRAFGTLEVRYGYSVAHLDTSTDPSGQSRIELLGGSISGAPPLANLAVRPRHGFEAAWQPGHGIAAGGGWQRSAPLNRFATPSNSNLITVNGSPAFALEFNTPLDSSARVQSLSAYLADHGNLTPTLAIDVGALADSWRGSLPAQSSPSGAFAPARPGLIVWNSLAPHAGFAWRILHAHGLIFRGTYFRLYAPLAGRLLDYGNPNSLGGSAYRIDAAGTLLARFGGPYSSIAPDLRRPYSDEFDVSAEFAFAPAAFARIHLFRRDDKDRIAAINSGVPAQAFTPVSIADPGPDGIPGTFDDRRLTVYAQNPATLGQDRYLLTNPAGLRTLNSGVLAEAGIRWRRLTLHASFVAEKSYGPTNPGDAFYENDPGVVGSLFLDPNTAINATGRSFMDRAYVGKLQAAYRLPAAWGGIEVASVADYLDGLVFARQLLVTGLPQGPFLVAATVRGSPGGGNRAEHVTNWNLRLSREFAYGFGRLTLTADILNVTNAAHRLQENDLTGASFNMRLPVAIQPPRFVRIGFRFEF